MAWAPGTLGGLGDSSASQFHQMPFLYHDVPSASIHDAASFGNKANRPPAQFFAVPACPSGWHLHGMGPGDLGGTRQSLAIQFHQMPSIAATYCAHPFVMQLLLALRLTGPQTKFIAVPAWSPGRHLHGMRPSDFGAIRGMASVPVSPDGLGCRDVLGASIHV